MGIFGRGFGGEEPIKPEVGKKPGGTMQDDGVDPDQVLLAADQKRRRAAAAARNSATDTGQPAGIMIHAENNSKDAVHGSDQDKNNLDQMHDNNGDEVVLKDAMVASSEATAALAVHIDQTFDAAMDTGDFTFQPSMLAIDPAIALALAPTQPALSTALSTPVPVRAVPGATTPHTDSFSLSPTVLLCSPGAKRLAVEIDGQGWKEAGSTGVVSTTGANTRPMQQNTAAASKVTDVKKNTIVEVVLDVGSNMVVEDITLGSTAEGLLSVAVDEASYDCKTGDQKRTTPASTVSAAAVDAATRAQETSKGVHWHTKDQQWHARLQDGDNRKHPGYFATKQEACAAVNAAKNRLQIFAANPAAPHNTSTVANQPVVLAVSSRSLPSKKKKMASNYGPSVYRGVQLHKLSNKWTASIRNTSKQIEQIGAFASEIEAARAFDVEARKAGRLGSVNFPLSVNSDRGRELPPSILHLLEVVATMPAPVEQQVDVRSNQIGQKWATGVQTGRAPKHLGRFMAGDLKKQENSTPCNDHLGEPERVGSMHDGVGDCTDFDKTSSVAKKPAKRGMTSTLRRKQAKQLTSTASTIHTRGIKSNHGDAAADHAPLHTGSSSPKRQAPSSTVVLMAADSSSEEEDDELPMPTTRDGSSCEAHQPHDNRSCAPHSHSPTFKQCMRCRAIRTFERDSNTNWCPSCKQGHTRWKRAHQSTDVRESTQPKDTEHERTDASLSLSISALLCRG